MLVIPVGVSVDLDCRGLWDCPVSCGAALLDGEGLLIVPILF
jgi:hypothetical protein